MEIVQILVVVVLIQVVLMDCGIVVMVNVLTLVGCVMVQVNSVMLHGVQTALMVQMKV